MSTKRSQAGLTVVEFAVVGAVFILILLACIEIARLLFVWNTLGEVTRAGARIAAVCPPGNEAVIATALLNEPGNAEESDILVGLTADNIVIDYLAADGSTGATVTTAEYVRVAISDYTISLRIPFVGAEVTEITAPPFTTTIPAESLGYVPETTSYTCLLPA